jgi:uncharacterized protein YyaL (SSP411 family)
MTRIGWLPWTADAFARAAAEQKPVLLSIVTSWSRGCREMDRTSFADQAVADFITDRFVAVRVDADRRPDISSRYTLGGWPTTAFLTPHGQILGGGTFVPVERLNAALRRVVDSFDAQTRWDEQTCRERRDPLPGPAPGLDQAEALVFGAYTDESGAFGALPHFPHTAPVHLALAHARHDSSSVHRDIATTCLDKMGWSGLFDEVEGGFFRYCNAEHWTCPQTEKLLDVNAALLMLYLDGFESLRLGRYAERAEAVLGYVQQMLADSQLGGWGTSQQEEPDYYAIGDAAARVARPSPAIDRTVLAAPNACMVSAALLAARVFGDEGLRDFALRSLDRIVLDHYRPGSGVAHCVEQDAPVRGLLDDQVATATALLDAFDTTADVVYQMMAEELARQLIPAFHDEGGGGLFDRAPSESDVGLLKHRMKPFVGNCEAARMLSRLARACSEPAFNHLAEETLRAVGGHSGAHGPLAAHYVLALREASVR